MKNFNEYKPWQLKGVLEMLVPLVIAEISKSRKVNYDEAIELLYPSLLYKSLEKESTKMWHLSQLTLSELLNEELKTGKITFPEEA
ncbi:MAG: hypothetical protein LBN20_05475 [Endomicrobium sp.]|jgi:hypothetical protein|nr:hypothetical protein [Endomicrobium sp.]